MHVFQIKQICNNVSKSQNDFSQNWFNVALIFHFSFGLFAIDGDKMVCHGFCHYSLFCCCARGTEIVSKIF